MTPQELMDLPGYGSAEKVLRNTGKWRMTPMEDLEDKIIRLEGSLGDVADAVSDASNYLFGIKKSFKDMDQ